MNTPAGQNSGAYPPLASLRPEQPGGEGFLFEVFASTRAEELALTNWNETMRRAFLNQQFSAMRHGYRSMFPSGEFWIVELAGKMAGRMVISRSPAEIRVVDLALLTEHRSRGVGSFLMRQVCAQATDAGKPVRLSVLKYNRAFNWYERLGFNKISESGCYDEMEWRPAGIRCAVNPVSPNG